MKKHLLLAAIALFAIGANAQSDKRSVTGSDISGKYKQAVHNGFYHTLSNYSGLEQGYHGFADLGYTFGIGDYDFGRFEFNSSHGYQF
ncbi:MAG: hypothetical protein Q4F84_10935, partial [Fibrobacter sp.]|nr:hypothetical protein [Fibrobacter sp.]